jgi:hypothetical protein
LSFKKIIFTYQPPGETYFISQSRTSGLMAL